MSVVCVCECAWCMWVYLYMYMVCLVETWMCVKGGRGTKRDPCWHQGADPERGCRGEKHWGAFNGRTQGRKPGREPWEGTRGWKPRDGPPPTSPAWCVWREEPQEVTIRGWTQGEGTGEGTQGVTIRRWTQVGEPREANQAGWDTLPRFSTWHPRLHLHDYF